MQKNILLTIIISCMLLIGGCVTKKEGQISEKGYLVGKVSIGPLCPVERIPPDPRCQPNEETFKAWPIAVYTMDKRTKIANIEPDLNGTYRIELSVGKYIVDAEKHYSVGGSNLPAEVTINSNETTTLDIDIDTGIR